MMDQFTQSVESDAPQTRSSNDNKSAANRPAPRVDRRAPLDIDVVYTTFDEEINLPHSLRTVCAWANRIFVVDSGSTDRTCEIAEHYGARCVHRGWRGYGDQKNWALANLPLTANWVLLLDGDESVRPDLHAAMERVARQPVEDVPTVGYYVNRYFLFLGKPIRHCGYYPSWNIRFFKRGRAWYEPREVHEHMIVDGPTAHLDGHMEHWDRRGLGYWNAKHNKYADLEAREIYRVIHGQSKVHQKPRLFGGHDERVRWIKHYLYPRLPAKWLCRFLYMFILKKGALDGLNGFRFCLFIAAYELMVDLNLKEYKKSLKKMDTEHGSATTSADALAGKQTASSEAAK